MTKFDRQFALLQEHGMTDVWQNLMQSTQDAAFVELVQLLVTLDPEQCVHQGSHLLGHLYLQTTPTLHLSSPDTAHSQPVASVPEPGYVAPVDLAGMVQVPGLKAVYCNQDAVFCETAGGVIYRSADEYSRIAWLSLLHMCTYMRHAYRCSHTLFCPREHVCIYI